MSGNPENSGSDPAKRDKKGRFGPGNRANVAGRPRKGQDQRAFEKLCRTYSPEALEAILEILRDRSHARRLQAAKVVLEYAYGKPKQVTVLKSDEDGDGIITLHATLDPRAKEKKEKDDDDS